jgi:hypothetical protein
MNFLEFSAAAIFGVTFAATSAAAQDGVTVTVNGADNPSEFPLEELAVSALSGALIAERNHAGTGHEFLQSNFGLSSSGSKNILAVLEAQAARATDPKARLREYCTALANVTSRSDALKIMQSQYSEDMKRERARGAELLESLNSTDLAKLTEILAGDIRPAATKTTTNFDAILDQQAPAEYRKSICDLADKGS